MMASAPHLAQSSSKWRSETTFSHSFSANCYRACLKVHKCKRGNETQIKIKNLCLSCSRVTQITRAALKKLRCWRIRMRKMLSPSIVRGSQDGHGIISMSRWAEQLSESVSLQCDDPVSELGMWSRPISGYHPVCHPDDAGRDSSNRQLHPRSFSPPTFIRLLWEIPNWYPVKWL